MAVLTGGSFKEISPDDIKVRTTTLNQLIDVIQEDVSGSATRKAYQVFVTGGIGPGVTSSLFQTVYDQDFTLQTANPIFDVTVGLSATGTTVTECSTGTEASSGKLLFPSQSLMMREKVDIYKQFASNLLGSSTATFTAPFGQSSGTINEAVFLSFKRLFARDSIKRETFAIRMFQSASDSKSNKVSNIDRTSESGPGIFTDIGAASNQRRTFGGEVGNIVNASNTNNTVGLIFYDSGTVVLDASKVFSGSQHMSGAISGLCNAVTTPKANEYGNLGAGVNVIGTTLGNRKAKLIPDLFVSASVDDIVDHICETRFSSGSLTSVTFQNVTNINSTLVFCRASADEFNYSSNPTFKDNTGRIKVIDAGQEETQRSFVFPTTVGLHDERGRLLAVAKMSRPIEKNDEKDITFRIRLDF